MQQWSQKNIHVTNMDSKLYHIGLCNYFLLGLQMTKFLKMHFSKSITLNDSYLTCNKMDRHLNLNNNMSLFKTDKLKINIM